MLYVCSICKTYITIPINANTLDDITLIHALLKIALFETF